MEVMIKVFNMIEDIENASIDPGVQYIYRVTNNMMLVLDDTFVDLMKKSDSIWIHRQYMSMNALELASKLDNGDIMNKWMESANPGEDAPDFPMFLSNNFDADILLSTSRYETNDTDMRKMIKCCIVDIPAMKLAESLGNEIFLPGGDAQAIVFSSQSCVYFIKEVVKDGTTTNKVLRAIPYEKFIRLLGIEF